MTIRWTIRTTRDSRLSRILRRPLLTTSNRARAEQSRLTYGDNGDGTYSTSLLGILHGTTALALDYPPYCDRRPCQQDDKP